MAEEDEVDSVVDEDEVDLVAEVVVVDVDEVAALVKNVRLVVAVVVISIIKKLNLMMNK